MALNALTELAIEEFNGFRSGWREFATYTDDISDMFSWPTHLPTLTYLPKKCNTGVPGLHYHIHPSHKKNPTSSSKSISPYFFSNSKASHHSYAFICIFQKTAVTNQDLIYKHHFASPRSHCLFTTTMRYHMKTSYGSDAVTSSCGLKAHWLQILGFLLCFWLRKRKVEAPRQRGPESVEQEMGNEKLEQMQVWDVIVYNANSA